MFSEEENEKEKENKYIPVYKKGFRSKTYHPKSQTKTKSFESTLLHKQKYNNHSKTQQHRKIIKHFDKVLVFDLDETLGSFSELQWLWNAMIHLHENTKKNKKNILKTLIDIYPEFLRPGIIHILEYISQKKIKGECIAIFLYTNNQQPPPWTEFIVDYFNQYIEEKTHIRPFFDQIIQAFKIGQEKVEWLRTSHDKSYDDFIKCSILPKNTEICFVDNTYFNSMIHPKVYYIQPKSYIHTLSQKDMIDRFILAETSGILDDYFPTTIRSFPSASSFLFFSTAQISNSQKQSRKHFIRKFIQQTMEEFTDTKIKRLNAVQFSTTPPLLLSKSTATINPQTYFQNVQIDLFVSQKLMNFIREFFILTTFTNMSTRKRIPLSPSHSTTSTPSASSSCKIQNSSITDSKIITLP